MVKNNEVAKRKWADLLTGQFNQQEAEKPFKCEKCFRRFKTKQGFESHQFHNHGEFEGKFRRRKKPKKKFELTSKRLKQRGKAGKGKKWKHRSKAEKIQLIHDYDFAQNKADWEKQNVNHARISEWKKQLGIM